MIGSGLDASLKAEEKNVFRCYLLPAISWWVPVLLHLGLCIFPSFFSFCSEKSKHLGWKTGTVKKCQQIFVKKRYNKYLFNSLSKILTEQGTITLNNMGGG